MKFLFNLSTQTLKIPSGANCFLVLTEDRQFRKLGGVGFVLDYTELEPQREPPLSWITFSVYRERIKAIYKSPSGTYYRREIIRPPSGIVEVEFSEWDRMKK